jgi:hypothetical protein
LFIAVAFDYEHEHRRRAAEHEHIQTQHIQYIQTVYFPQEHIQTV